MSDFESEVSNSNLYDKWQEFKVLVESIEPDIAKNVSGNKSAGVRARKGLRAVKSAAAQIVKMSLEKDK